ncbi:Dolichol-phosphate mannosyltransferase subunit 1 [Vitis vinifera]|uniref:dolichyl-phosphate beta-D-mannosyltransferase n=1 Tax=Vitis vinifera TaxID=29760 RepID=A0A438K405_VITVI|nr:Dolichol-phosphate mannosyltransferase subunit 1 [Vitis vinifera]
MRCVIAWERKSWKDRAWCDPRSCSMVILPVVCMLCLTLCWDVDFEIIIVDDGSPDGTQEIVKQLQQVYGEDRILLRARPKKLGLGTAYSHGLKHASGNFVVIMDADLSHHVSVFHMVWMVIWDNVEDLGLDHGETIPSGENLAKIFAKLYQGANVLAQTLLWPGVSDLTGSFRLYKKSVLEEVISSCVSKGYVFQMEIIVRASRKGYHIEEVEIYFCLIGVLIKN